MSRLLVAGNLDFLRANSPPATALPFSWFVWFKPVSLSNLELLWLGNPAVSNNYWTCGIDSGGLIRNSARNTTESPAVTTAGPVVNVWQNGGGAQIATNSRNAYLNGSNKGVSSTNAAPNSISRFSVGVLDRSAPSNYFDGLVAHIAFWSGTLTDGDYAALNAGVNPLLVKPGSLIDYWPLLSNQSPEPSLVSGRLLIVNGTTFSNDNPPVSGTKAGGDDAPEMLRKKRKTTKVKDDVVKRIVEVREMRPKRPPSNLREQIASQFEQPKIITPAPPALAATTRPILHAKPRVVALPVPAITYKQTQFRLDRVMAQRRQAQEEEELLSM